MHGHRKQKTDWSKNRKKDDRPRPRGEGEDGFDRKPSRPKKKWHENREGIDEEDILEEQYNDLEK